MSCTLPTQTKGATCAESDPPCRDVLRFGMASTGIEVHVSTLGPIVPPAYDPSPMRCPHGVTYWIAPTSEQIAEWVAGGVA